MGVLIDGVTSGLLSKALDICMANHRVIANNIANVYTEDFTTKRLNFDALMQSASEAVITGEKLAIKEATGNITTATLPIISSEQPVELDVEMVELTNNTLRFQALVDIRSGLGNLRSTAISGSIK